MTQRFPVPRGLAAAALSLVLALFAPRAFAGGVNLSWDECGAFGTGSKTFACNTNTGGDLLYVSAIPASPMAALNGHEAVITVSTNSNVPLPFWWQRQTGGCRAGAPPANVDFSNNFACRNVWGSPSAAVGSSTFEYPVTGFGANVARIRTLSAMPAGNEVAVNATQEIYLVRISLTHQKSTGLGACAGCATSACLILQNVKLIGSGGYPTQTISNPLIRQHVYWQDPSQLSGCPGATPTRNRTWGSVKTLYR